MNRARLIPLSALLMLVIACGTIQGAVATATVPPTAAPVDTAAPSLPPPTPTDAGLALTEEAQSQLALTATAAASCLRWDEVTADMKGETHCVRGVIYSFTQSRKVGTRYSFSEKPNTFFMFSAKWEFYDPFTGKTLGEGRCIDATAQIRLQGDVPFISLDDIAGEAAGEEIEDLRFYEEDDYCK